VLWVVAVEQWREMVAYLKIVVLDVLGVQAVEILVSSM
jgi:hypothetical protein